MRSPLLLLALTVPMAAQTPIGTVSLANLRDHARPLLIFAPQPNDPQLQIQLRQLHDNTADVTNRDIVVIAVPFNGPPPTQAKLTGSDAQAARQRFHVRPGDFTVLLIGKDGGEKLRSHRPISVDTLRSTIDAMPMRQEEMQAQSKTVPKS